MRIATTLCLLSLMSIAAPAAAQINLSWDDCGVAGVEQKPFACNTNSGSVFKLVASFKPPEAMPAFIGLEARLLVLSSADLVPDWWRFGADSCRGSNALSLKTDFTAGPFTCSNPYVDAQSGWIVSPIAPNRYDIRLIVAMPAPTALESREYYGFQFWLNRLRTTGADACAGCSTPVCVVLEYVTLQDSTGAVSTLTSTLDRNNVSWQRATFVNEFPVGLACFPQDPVRATRSTWGFLKSLYR